MPQNLRKSQRTKTRKNLPFCIEKQSSTLFSHLKGREKTRSYKEKGVPPGEEGEFSVKHVENSSFSRGRTHQPHSVSLPMMSTVLQFPSNSIYLNQKNIKKSQRKPVAFAGITNAARLLSSLLSFSWSTKIAKDHVKTSGTYFTCPLMHYTIYPRISSTLIASSPLK